MEDRILTAAGPPGGNMPTPQPEIRPLRQEDIAAYLETGRAAYRDHYCHLWPGGDPYPYLHRNFTEAIVNRELADPNVMLWLILCDGTPAGICKLRLDKPCRYVPSSDSVFLEKIYFKDRFTGRGLGTAVMAGILARARSWGRDFLWLEAMQKGPALAFYRRSGFEILGETQVPYPEVLEDEKPMWILGRSTH